MGTQIPQQQEVAGITVYNIDVQNTESVKHLKERELGIKSDQNQHLFYRCSRKFCSFCLETSYGMTNFTQLQQSHSWVCQSCVGVCQCSRCVRQDILTQVKGMLISMGGRLSLPKPADKCSKIDTYIVKNFNTSLELACISNPEALGKHFSELDLPRRNQKEVKVPK